MAFCRCKGEGSVQPSPPPPPPPNILDCCLLPLEEPPCSMPAHSYHTPARGKQLEEECWCLAGLTQLPTERTARTGCVAGHARNHPLSISPRLRSNLLGDMRCGGITHGGIALLLLSVAPLPPFPLLPIFPLPTASTSIHPPLLHPLLVKRFLLVLMCYKPMPT